MNKKFLTGQLYTISAQLTRLPLYKMLTDFSQGEQGVLASLEFRGKGLAAGELSELLKVSTARIASTLNTLVKKGYVTRSPDDYDKRKVIVNITDEGRVYLFERYKEIKAVLMDMTDYLGEDDTKELVRIINRITDFQYGDERET